MRKETVDIVEDLVSFLASKVIVDSIVNNNDGTYTFSTNNTSFLSPKMKVDIGGNIYYVINTDANPFVFNSKFTLKGNVDPTGTTEVFLPSLNYLHGTAIATKGYLDRENTSEKKYPLVYLLEVLRDKFNEDENLHLDRTSRLRLFFLSETDENNWDTDEHYEFSIKPMRNVVYNFIESLKLNRKIGKFDGWEAINHAKFGVYISDKGHTRRMFSDNLSGVELIIDLPILKELTCSKL